MWHIGILSEPISRFHFLTCGIEYTSGGYHPLGLVVLYLLCREHIAVLVVWFFAPVAEEIDAGGKEVDSGCLKELVTATASFFLTFCKDSSRVSAVSDAAARLLMYFNWIGFTLRLYSTSTKLMMLNLHPLGSFPSFWFFL